MTNKQSIRLKKYTEKNKKKLISFVLIAILACSFVFLGFTVIKNTADINRLEIRSEEIKTQYESEKEANDELLEILDSEDKDSYIEQKAREKGYAKSDEIVFYDISAGE